MAASGLPSYLYHYTTLEGLHGIVTKNVLWASNIVYLNDTQEFYEGLRYVREWLKDNASKDVRALSKSLDKVASRREVRMPVFVCSFSENKDDLSQWRAYCPAGGVAIGFRRQDLDDLRQMQDTTYGFRLMRCEYRNKKKRELIQSELRSIVEQMRQTIESARVNRNQIDEFRLRSLLWYLTGKPAALKDPAFKHEKEWRLIVVASPGMERDKNIRFRCCNGLLVPYTRFRLNPGGQGCIWKGARVIIGPHPHPSEMKASVKGLLMRYCTRAGIEASFEVLNSKRPYCYW